VTLFHWDLPQALQREMGGFAGRDCAALFADYAEVVARRIGDRVQNWITLNEPYVHAASGYLFGSHAPGQRNPWAFVRVVHHQLLAHGLAVARLKSLMPAANVGISLNLSPIYPRRDNDRDRDAVATVDQFVNRLFLDSLFKGHYPHPLWQQLRRFHPHIQADDLKTIATPLDFVGINYYTRQFVQHAWYVPLLRANVSRRAKASQEFAKNGVQYTDMGWEVYPAGLYELMYRLQKEYGNPPLFITENGAAYADGIVSNNGRNGDIRNPSTHDPRIRDPQRQYYLRQHLAVVDAAVKVGINVKGYFVWSLVDNFEWAYGYDKRFGLVYVDHKTQERTIKDSGYWYRDFINGQRTNGQ
jgi:beta-glucosidase